MWKPLFICGCPRSGTSAFQQVLTADTRIKVGMERYYFRAADKFSLSENLFSFERFFDLKEGDTFWPDINNINHLKINFNESIYRGDKIPKLYMHLDGLYNAMPNAKTIILVRNIIDVAASYNARANNSSDNLWSREQNYKVAVNDWNNSLTSIVEATEKGYDIYPLAYEEFFSNIETHHPLYNYLNIPISTSCFEKHKEMIKKSEKISSGRIDSLSSLEKKYILENSRLDLYQKIMNKNKTL